MTDIDDMSKLPSIDADIVMATLRRRQEADMIYTNNGAVLVAINPYKDVPLYGELQLATYKTSLALETEKPHVFSVAAATHRALISESRNQAIVISGESGAGKTESARFVLQYLRFVSGATVDLEQRITVSQPLTEAFGCAKTMRNDNSSRFGKFVKLYFDASARMQGASLSTYLLEKSRVTHIGAGERAYHIFYNMLRGLSETDRRALRLASSDSKTYKYLSAGDPSQSMGDVSRFAEVVGSLTAQNISPAEQSQYWHLLAGILLLGNVAFDTSRPDSASVLPTSTSALVDCEAVLGLQNGAVGKALCKRKIKAGNEWVEQDLHVEKANDGRDALSKAIYSRLFEHLVLKINFALSEGCADVSFAGLRTIGIVDIFGFEVFEYNSLEQLCINFANEKLQALFTKTVFIETVMAYTEDGIDAADITYVDNTELIESFDAPKSGLWALLTEECMVPKGSDQGFCEKLHDAQKMSNALAIVKGTSTREGFLLEHFAGAVPYSTSGWLDKNKDPLSGDLLVLMQFSDNSTLKELFAPDDAGPAARGTKFKSNKFKGVINAFRVQLQDLCTVLETSQLHFVRCFKPNDAKAPDTWDASTVSRQLHTSGVLDALRVARTGYPDRMPFLELVNLFADAARVAEETDCLAPKDACALTLKKLGVKPDSYRLGRERCFMAFGVLDALRTRRSERMATVCVFLQAAVRGMFARKRVRAILSERLERERELQAACAGTNIATLKQAIAAAEFSKAHLSPKGKCCIDAALAKLATLEKLAAERAAAYQSLDIAMNGYNIAALRDALNLAKSKGVEAPMVVTALGRLSKLEEEDHRRTEETKRLAVVAAAEKSAAEARFADERRQREAEEDARRKAEAEKKRRDEAAAEARREAATAAAAQEAAEAEALAAEAAEIAAMEEEEALREAALETLSARRIIFRSEAKDVLEYAVYLGMQLAEDIDLLWIADEALQAEDPDGWDQAESPTGDMYYIHVVTQQVLWQHPLDYSYQQKYLQYKHSVGNGPPLPCLSPPATESCPQAVDNHPEGQGGRHAAVLHRPDVNLGTISATPALSSDDQLRARLQDILRTKHTDLRSMLLEPSSSLVPIQCYVLRHKSRIGGTRFDFFMSLSSTKDMYCFTGKKQSVSRGSYYAIALDQDEGKRARGAVDSFIGKLRSDRKAMEYTLFDHGVSPVGKEKGKPRRELMHVHFINSLRNRNPGAMHVGLPAVNRDGDALIFVPNADGVDSLEDRLKCGRTGEMHVFKNREPKWNAESQMYQLDFRGRATHASCKNIQLSASDGDQTDAQVLMGKVDDNKFNVDFQYPFSALQAFAFALVVFDNSSSSVTL